MIIDASAVAVEVEFCGYTDKESHAGDLQQQSGFKKEFAKVLLRGADGAVKKLGDTDGCQGSNDSVKTNEGGNDAARVDGGVIRDVIEDTAKDELVCAFIDRTGRISFSRLEDSLCFGLLTVRRVVRICLQSKCRLYHSYMHRLLARQSRLRRGPLPTVRDRLFSSF